MALVSQQRPDEVLQNLRSSLFILSESDLLSQDDFTRVLAHDNINDLTRSLRALNQAGILSRFTFESVLRHLGEPELLEISQELDPILGNDDILCLVTDYLNPGNLTIPLECMLAAGILNKRNFRALIHPEHSILLSERYMPLIWNRLSPVQLKQHWPVLLKAVKNDDNVTALITQIIHSTQVPPGPNLFFFSPNANPAEPHHGHLNTM